MGFRSIDLATLLEVVYRVEQTDAAWLKSILEAARLGMEQGMGIMGYFTDVSGSTPIRVWGLDAVGVDYSLVLEKCERTLKYVPMRVTRALHTFAPCGTVNYAPPWVFKEMSKEKCWACVGVRDLGVIDMLGVSGLDATGQGCILLAWLPRTPREPPTTTMLELWGRISAHLAAAARLQRRFAADSRWMTDSAEAILSPGGRVEHATGAARDKLARSLLRDAVLSVDRARTRRNRLDPQETSELWQALFAGRWSLVDHFDSDGRHFVVAHRNEPATVAPAPLTAREWQVARAAALGHSNKLIAYELGIAISTVGTHLTNAAKKLGVSTRVELINRVLCLEQKQS